MPPFDQPGILVIGAGRTGTFFAEQLEQMSLPYLLVDMKPLRPAHPRHLGRVTVLGIDADREVMAEYDGKLYRFHCPAIVAATGSRSIPVPFPGWTLPGVILASAAELLLQTPEPVLGQSVVLLTGQPEGPLAAKVRAAAKQATILHWDDLAWIEAGGKKGVQRFSWRRKANAELSGPAAGPPAGGAAESVEADTVIVDAGWMPNVELFHSSGFEMFVDERGFLQVARHENGETKTAPGIFVVGKAAGVDKNPSTGDYAEVFQALRRYVDAHNG
ncbi:MAG: hypothetical protein C0P68_009405 [Bacillota bacterium]